VVCGNGTCAIAHTATNKQAIPKSVVTELLLTLFIFSPLRCIAIDSRVWLIPRRLARADVQGR
jgi:hypothetical protein